MRIRTAGGEEEAKFVTLEYANEMGLAQTRSFVSCPTETLVSLPIIF